MVFFYLSLEQDTRCDRVGCDCYLNYYDSLLSSTT